MKSKKLASIVLSVLMLASAFAVPITANAATTTVEQTSSKNLDTPKITKTENVYGGVKLAWNKVNGAEKYRVYYKSRTGWKRMGETTSTSFIDKDVTSGKSYTYTVRCISANSKRFTSGYDSKGTRATYVASPEITKIENIYGKTKITWNKVNGAEKYRVYVRRNNKWTKFCDTTSNSATDTIVTSGKTYTYTIRCINSSATKFTSGYNASGKSVEYIAAPELIKIEGSNEGVKLTWNKPAGSVKYRAYRRGSNGWIRLTETANTSYTDKSAKAGNNYIYTVRCLTSDSKRFTSGFNSNGESFKLLTTPNVKASANDESVKLSWDKVNGAEKYRVYYKSRKGWTRMVDTTSTSYIDKDVSSGKTYTYTVRCINSSATKFTSGYDSKGVTVTTPVKPSVKLDKTSLTLTKGKTYTLKTTVTGTNKTVSWSSSNASVASVDKNGKVTAKTKGTATITAKVDGVSASCKVTVNESAKTTIKLDKTKVTLGVGEPCTLNATVSPSQKVTWTSSNPKLVKVDSNGKLTVTKALYDIEDYWADVKITAKANGVSATCIVSANGYRTYHKYAIVPVYEPTDLDVCKGCGRLIKYNAAPGTKYETEDGRKGVFITKEDHTAHWKAHMNEGVPSGWYSEVVMLKVGERVQREGWYVD